MKIGSILNKMKSLGGKGLDLAGRGALYSQVFGSGSNQSMTMGQRIGGALTSAVLDNTLGQMGTLGGALRGGLQSRGAKQSPTGGGGVPGTTIPFTPIKTENVVQAINQSTQQTINALNTLNATFRIGLNATANQMQAQASGITSLKIDTQDMVISLREIYDLLNKQDYESTNRGASRSTGIMPVNSDSATPSTANNSSIVDSILGLAALGSLGRMALPLLTAGGGIGGIVLGLAALGGIGAWIMGSKPAAEAQKAQEKAAANIPSNFNKNVTITNPRAAGAAGTKKTSDSASTKKDDDTIKLINRKAIFVMGEMEGTVITVLWLNNDGMYEVEYPDGKRTKVGSKTFKFLDEGSSLQKSQEVKVASNNTSTMSDAGGMSSGDYLVNRQKMLDAEKAKTSEEKLRAKEQEYEASVKDLLTMLKYEAREVLFNADNIKFDASKIEFTEGGTGGGGSSYGGGGYGPGGGGGYGSGGGGYGADATKIPELSAETKAAAQQLQEKNVFRVSPGAADPLGQYSEEQLRSQGIVSHTNKDGTKVYTYAPGGIGSNADKVGGSGATQAVSRAGGFVESIPGISETANAPLTKAMNTLMTGNKELGLEPMTADEAKYFIANFGSEGGFTPSAIGDTDTVAGGSHGLGQWNRDRLDNLKKFAKDANMDWQSPEAQALFTLHETQKGGKKQFWKDYQQAVKSGNKEEAYRLLRQKYEVGLYGGSNRRDFDKYLSALENTEIKSSPNAAGGPTAQAPDLVAGLQGLMPSNAQAGVGPGGININEAYGRNRPGRPDESIRNIGSSAGEAAGMSAITFTSGKGDYISESGRRKGQTFTWHSTGKAVDVSGFSSDEERLRFIEEAVARGAKGVGVYKDGSVHIDEGNERSWSWGGISKKHVDAAIARGKKKRTSVMAQEKKKREDAEKQKEEVKAKIDVKEESGLEKGAAKLGVTPESKQRMVEQNKANQVAELSKKTTMNREAAIGQGPVTQNIISNNRQEADTTGTGYPSKDMPLPGFTPTMDKHLDMLWT